MSRLRMGGAHFFCLAQLINLHVESCCSRSNGSSCSGVLFRMIPFASCSNPNVSCPRGYQNSKNKTRTRQKRATGKPISQRRRSVVVVWRKKFSLYPATPNYYVLIFVPNLADFQSDTIRPRDKEIILGIFNITPLFWGLLRGWWRAEI